jgi:hypothetical protein
MYAAEVSNFSLWWLFPLVMIALCFLMMRGQKGSMMCGFGSRDEDSHGINVSDSVKGYTRQALCKGRNRQGRIRREK